MTVEYQKVWRTMNDLEVVTSKICSAREIIDAAIDRIQEHQYDKAETMIVAAYEFLEYYLQEFDDKFKLAWQATVGDLRDGDVKKEPFTCDKDDPSPECRGAWNNFWEENYHPEKHKKVKVDGYSVDNVEHSKYYYDHDRNDPNRPNPFEKKKWILPTKVDGLTGDVFVNFPDDLLEAANLKEGDEVQWIDNSDGSFKIVKVIKPLESDEC